MEIDRPGPGEELNAGDVTPPRLAASVIVLRGGTERLELLLVQRNPEQRFMGGAWVFPGGAVDRHEGSDDAALRTAALRELQEEAGLTVTDPGALHPFSRWITPEEVKIRFDTWFFLTEAPADQEVAIDGNECVDARWCSPADALGQHARGELLLVFPTIKHLEQLSAFPTTAALLDHARGKEVRPVLPRVLVTGETARILLPDEDGYAEAERQAAERQAAGSAAGDLGG